MAHGRTVPAQSFFQDLKQLLELVRLVVENVDDVKSYRAVIERSAASKEQLLELLKTQGVPIEAYNNVVHGLDPYRNLLAQMMLCRGVDNFLTYISELLTLIFRTRPEILKSSRQVKLDWILQYQTMEDLILGLVERRVDELAYESLADLANDISKELGFQLFTSDEDSSHAILINAERNIIVHNRAVINRRFLAQTGVLVSAKLSVRLGLDLEVVIEELLFLARLVNDIDVRAVQKFNLPLVLDDDA